MPALSKAELHERVIGALGSEVASHGDLTHVPFVLQVSGLIPLAVWAFTITSPPGGRHPLESKIQLMVPGQGRDERGSLRPDDPDLFPVLIGVKPDEDLFVLWDAWKHEGFAFSKNVQVRAQPLIDAQTFGIGEASRRLASGEEMILAARGDYLREALRRRIVGGD